MTTRNVSDTMPRLLRPWRHLDQLWRSFAYLAIGVPLGTQVDLLLPLFEVGHATASPDLLKESE